MFPYRKVITLAASMIAFTVVIYMIVAATHSCTFTFSRPFLICSMKESSEAQIYSLPSSPGFSSTTSRVALSSRSLKKTGGIMAPSSVHH